jgi:uncharacterized repeat protein (TIGR04076 family)
MTAYSGTTIITGASRGIGEAIARILASKIAAEHGRLVLVARDEDRLKHLSEEIRSRQQTDCEYFICDLADREAVQRLIDKYPKASVLINNAGFIAYGSFHKLTWQLQNEMIEVNVTALTRLCHHYVQGMCPLAFYAVFPYYLTLIHNGNFEWVRKGDSVKVQCPKPGGVAMAVEPVEIDSLGIGVVRARIIKLERSCPAGHALGDSFLLDSRNQTLCFHAAATVIPVSVSSISDVPQLCVGSNNSVIFKVKDHDDSL